MRTQRDLTNNKYGNLTVLKPLGYHRENDHHFWSLVKCDCGIEFPIHDSLLVSGRRTQCPTCSNEDRKTHGMSESSIFHIWGGMKGRCYNPNNGSYPDYGGRGIVVCDEWIDSFQNFYEWSMKNGYQEGLSIDRIDVNGNYEPSNCRWADIYTQARNRRDTIYVDYEGKKLSVQEVSDITGIKAGTIIYRLNNGWSDYDSTHIQAGCSGITSDGMWKKKAYLKSKDSNEEMMFDSCSEASRFLGFNVGYISNFVRKHNTQDFEVGKYHVRVEEHCYKL